MAIANGQKHHTNTPSPISSRQYSKPKPTETKSIKPKCDLDILSDIAYNIFYRVYSKFCKQIDKDQKKEKDNRLAWIVDIHRDKIPNRKRGFLKGQTPPPDPNFYIDFNFGLVWDQKSDTDKGKYAMSCYLAFENITFACGHTGGEQSGIAQDMSVSTDCGKFSYKISGSSMPKLEDPHYMERKCNDPKDLKDKDPGPVSSDRQTEYTDAFYDKTKRKKLRAHNNPIKYEVFDMNTGI